jgi:MoxR-like ATPase
MAYWLWSIPPENFPAYDRAGTFAVRRVGRAAMQEVRPGDRIFAYLPGRRALAGLYEATSAAFEDATSLVRTGTYPHRVRVRPLVRLSDEAHVAVEAFADKLTVTDEYAGRGEDPGVRFAAVAQRVVHPLPNIDGKVLEFLVRTREGSDLDAMMAAFERLQRAQAGDAAPAAVAESGAGYRPSPEAWDRAEATERLVAAVEARGFVYEPWQVAAFVTALRTKPFVILAGVTGVGKSRLPLLVAEATGSAAHVVPVRPDWTDSAEVLGYRDLQGDFRPGALLRAAREAVDAPERYALAVLDEMNLARPEHYLAEVLSRIEGRRPAPGGGYESDPLLTDRDVRLPPNLGLVGTVNMDESAYAFSRKVLDRAFTLELSDVDLGAWREASSGRAPVERWPVEAWWPRAVRLGELDELSEAETATVERVVAVLDETNALLAPAGLGIGYRVRDEAALFVLHAQETPGAFRTRAGAGVEPLDLALFMKLLPRIAGNTRSVRRALFSLLGWATDGTPLRAEDDVREAVDAWDRAGRSRLSEARFPRTAGRLALMTDRLLADGFASFWE